MNTPFVRLDLSLEHAQAVGTLLDFATRIHMGQVSEILALVQEGTIPMRDDAVDGSKRPAAQDERNRIEDVLIDLRRAMGHASGSHFGIGNVSDEAKLGYEAMKALKQAIHQHLRPEVEHVVDADGVTVRYSKNPIPEAKVILR